MRLAVTYPTGERRIGEGQFIDVRVAPNHFTQGGGADRAYDLYVFVSLRGNSFYEGNTATLLANRMGLYAATKDQIRTVLDALWRDMGVSDGNLGVACQGKGIDEWDVVGATDVVLLYGVTYRLTWQGGRPVVDNPFFEIRSPIDVRCGYRVP